MGDFMTHWKAVSALLGKYDARDKILAATQYGCLGAAAGTPGVLLNAAQAIGAARKPFRLGKPIEMAIPLLAGAAAPASAPEYRRALLRVKTLGMIGYLGLDNLGFLDKVGAISLGDKQTVSDLAKTSYRGWFIASLAQVLLELDALARAAARGAAAADSGDREGQEAAAAARDRAALAALQATCQTILAGSMGDIVKGLSPSTTGPLGVASSLLALYMMAVPPGKPKKA